MLYSNYVGCEVTRDEAEEALELYIEYCEKEKLEPEVEVDNIEQFEDNTSGLDHVLYHAQTFMGMANLLNEE